MIQCQLFAARLGAGRELILDPDLIGGRIVPTGFAALDAILGMGGLPRDATVALRGGASSGKTTVALRVAAEAQAARASFSCANDSCSRGRSFLRAAANSSAA